MEKDVETGLGCKENLNGASQNFRADSPSSTIHSQRNTNGDLQTLPTTHSYHLSLSEVQSVDVEVRELAVNIDISPSRFSLFGVFSGKRRQDGEPTAQQKQLLYSISASMPAGTLTAIIGGSGSGKTTLLNTMSGRMSGGRISTRGTSTFNGMKGVDNVRSAYVMQQDILLPTLTVRETLQFSADLRLPPPTTEEQRKKIVEEVIMELGLKECADTRIGNHQHKGCSGGEKRRTSIGVQLLSNPSVLFLDEPTTGLDATSAFQLIQTLKRLAQKGRTIITTIHQPRSEIWGLFDGLVILSRGSPVYADKVKDCIDWFGKLGFKLPPFVNPAEHLIDVSAVDNRSPEREAASGARVETLKQAWMEQSHKIYDITSEKGTVSIPPSAREQIQLSRRHSPFVRQTKVLTARTLLTTYRDPLGMTGCLVQAILLGVMSGWVFLNLGRDQSGIRSREGALYNASALQGYLILMFETYRLSIDTQVFDREHNENVVDILPFMLSRRLARSFTEDIPVPIVFSLLTYFMQGFRHSATTYLTYFSIILLNQYIAVTFAMCCIAVSRSFATASLIGNLGYTVQSFACGFFVQSNTIPVYVRWLKWTAYVYYSFGALCANEFVGQFYDCPLEGGESNPACSNYTGAYIMSSLGLPQNWILIPILALVGYIFMFYGLAAISFKLFKVEMIVAKQRTPDTDLSAGKEQMTARSADEVRTVDIALNEFALDLDKRSYGGAKKLPTKTILHPISASFKAGVMNVIMGPSGSGKTSLLNAMALRLHGDTLTRYRESGEMTFNGAVPADSVIRSVCSYVCQDDDALLPCLTVRETLRFSAKLRLPKYMTTAQKNQRAEDVLLKLGLKDCADNLIGSDLIKGISGGEKRRVSIAVQILTDPRILMLDEPTSGLDAFTALSIMEVLQGLADEGRTLLLTIHQCRSDLFYKFGNVLLLARGGFPIYSGDSKGMLPHFEGLGFPCPVTTNPADFALDLITVDLQHTDREEATRIKVQSLVASWSSGKYITNLHPTEIATPAQLGALVRKAAGFFSAYPILVHRASINFLRQRSLWLDARIGQVLGLSIFLGLFFAPLKFDYYAVQSRLGFIQEFCAFYFVGLLNNVAVYPNERDVFYRENDDGTYGVEAFLAQYTTLEIPFEIISSLLFAILVDLACGLSHSLFFICFFNCFCIVSCGESLGIIFNTLLSHTGFAVNITSGILSVAQFMSGVLSIHMPAFLLAVNYLSPIHYAIRNLAPYTLRSITFHCTEAQLLADGTCPITSGQQVLALYDLDTNAGLNLLGLGLCAVVYRFLAYAVLKFKRMHWGKSRGDRVQRASKKREKKKA